MFSSTSKAAASSGVHPSSRRAGRALQGSGPVARWCRYLLRNLWRNPGYAVVLQTGTISKHNTKWAVKEGGKYKLTSLGYCRVSIEPLITQVEWVSYWLFHQWQHIYVHMNACPLYPACLSLPRTVSQSDDMLSVLSRLSIDEAPFINMHWRWPAALYAF